MTGKVVIKIGENYLIQNQVIALKVYKDLNGNDIPDDILLVFTGDKNGNSCFITSGRREQRWLVNYNQIQFNKTY